MSFFDRFRDRTESKKQLKSVLQLQETNISIPINSSKDIPYIDMYKSVSSTEKELVPLIVSAIAAGDYPDSQFQVIEVLGIDSNKELAVAIVSAIVAGESPDSHFVLKSITEVIK